MRQASRINAPLNMVVRVAEGGSRYELRRGSAKHLAPHGSRAD